MGEYNFEETKRYSKDMLLSFIVQGAFDNNKLEELKKEPEENQERIKQLYGDLSHGNYNIIEDKIKNENFRLENLENKINNEYVLHLIKKYKNTPSINNDVLEEMKKDVLLANRHNLNSSDFLFVHLCFAKTDEEFKNIKTALKLDNLFAHPNHLTFKIFNNKNVIENLKEEREIASELYFNQNKPLKSMSEFYDILRINKDRFFDENFVSFVEKLIKTKNPENYFDVGKDFVYNEKNGLYHLSNNLNEHLHNLNQDIMKKSHEIKNSHDLNKLERLSKIVDQTLSVIKNNPEYNYFDKISLDYVNASNNVRDREVDKAREKIANIKSAMRRGF